MKHLLAFLLLALLPAVSQAQVQSDMRGRLLADVSRLAAQAEAASEDAAPLNALARLFGADALANRLRYHREGERYFAGLEGGGGQWFDNAAAAQGFMLRSLVAESPAAPAEIRASLAALPNTATLAAVASTAAQSLAHSRLMLARGAVSQVAFTPKVALPAGQLVLAGPPGIRVDRLERSGDGLTASIAAAAPLSAGPVMLRLFAPGHGFVAVQIVPAYVLAGEGEPPLPARRGTDRAEAAPLLQVGDTVSDPLPAAGGRNHYRLLLAQPGSYRFSTSGATDTVLSVLDANGTRLGRDDDSGQRYNARLGLSLAPGLYTIVVEHCCAGQGYYRLDIAAGP